MKNPKKLKIKSLKNHSWADKDTVILHACFQLLIDFVEKEKIDIVLNGWNVDENSKKIRAEIDALYQWWKSYVPKFKKNEIDYMKVGEHYELENAMLMRLIKIRQHLWI